MVTLLNHENVDINIRGNNLILNMNKPTLNYSSILVKKDSKAK